MTRYKELYLFLRIKFFFYLQNRQYASTIPVIAITVPHKTSESSIMTIIPAANQNNANPKTFFTILLPIFSIF